MKFPSQSPSLIITDYLTDGNGARIELGAVSQLDGVGARIELGAEVANFMRSEPEGSQL